MREFSLRLHDIARDATIGYEIAAEFPPKFVENDGTLFELRFTIGDVAHYAPISDADYRSFSAR